MCGGRGHQQSGPQPSEHKPFQRRCPVSPKTVMRPVVQCSSVGYLCWLQPALFPSLEGDAVGWKRLGLSCGHPMSGACCRGQLCGSRAESSSQWGSSRAGVRHSGEVGRMGEMWRPVVLPCKALPWQLNPFLGLYLLSCPCALWLSVGTMSKFPGVPWKLYFKVLLRKRLAVRE